MYQGFILAREEQTESMVTKKKMKWPARNTLRTAKTNRGSIIREKTCLRFKKYTGQG